MCLGATLWIHANKYSITQWAGRGMAAHLQEPSRILVYDCHAQNAQTLPLRMPTIVACLSDLSTYHQGSMAC